MASKPLDTVAGVTGNLKQMADSSPKKGEKMQIGQMLGMLGGVFGIIGLLASGACEEEKTETPPAPEPPKIPALVGCAKAGGTLCFGSCPSGVQELEMTDLTGVEPGQICCKTGSCSEIGGGKTGGTTGVDLSSPYRTIGGDPTLSCSDQPGCVTCTQTQFCKLGRWIKCSGNYCCNKTISSDEQSCLDRIKSEEFSVSGIEGKSIIVEKMIPTTNSYQVWWGDVSNKILTLNDLSQYPFFGNHGRKETCSSLDCTFKANSEDGKALLCSVKFRDETSTVVIESATCS